MSILAADIATVPADVLKYILITLGWLATTGAAIYGGARWSKHGTRESPLSIEQPLDVRRHDAAARKSELDKVEGALTKVVQRVDDLADQVTAQFRAAQQAGEARVSAITQNIDEELASLSTRIGTLAEALHDKINKAVVDNARQGSDISHLQTDSYRHTSEIAAIRSAIQDLLKNGSKAKH